MNKAFAVAVFLLSASAIGIVLFPALAVGQESVLYAFRGNDGEYPANVIFGPDGSLYGTTGVGGNCEGCGTVFRLAPSSGGAWIETTIHTFTGPPDGNSPTWGLISDASGNLYGTTNSGGNGTCPCGTVFELSPTSNGGYSYQVIYSFASESDGESPHGLVLDSSGNVYGTTQGGGSLNCSVGCGTIFELSPPAIQGGSWTKTILYSFTGGSDGSSPQTPAIDAQGNLYGFAAQGGNVTGNFCKSLYGCGTAFRLSPSTGGEWQFSVLFTFSQSTGAEPVASPLLDAAGNVYGIAGVGGRSCPDGSPGCGTVFQLVPNTQGAWSLNLLHQFTGAFDGAFPLGSLAMDPAGNIYGTTIHGGATNCAPANTEGCGTVFELSPSNGLWHFTRLWEFPGKNNGGFFPEVGLTLDAAGNLYGSTAGGGFWRSGYCQAIGCGVIFELSHSASHAK